MKGLDTVKDNMNKMALPATHLAAIAIGATVALVLVVIWLFSAPPEEQTPVFSVQDQGQVIYVPGASGGAYRGVGYANGGEVQSGIRTKLSRDMELMQRENDRRAKARASQLEQDEEKVDNLPAEKAVPPADQAAAKAAPAAQQRPAQSQRQAGGQSSQASQAGNAMADMQKSMDQINAMQAQMAAMQAQAGAQGANGAIPPEVQSLLGGAQQQQTQQPQSKVKQFKPVR